MQLLVPSWSVDIWFAPKAPAGKERSWIQTVPGEGFNVILRVYSPLEPFFTKDLAPKRDPARTVNQRWPALVAV